MDKKDLKILAHLRNNSRETLTKISRVSGIPISTIFDRMKDFEQMLRCRNTVLIDFSRMGFNARVKIVVKAERESRDNVKNFLLKHPSINSVYKINNGYDFLFEGIFRNVKDLEEFLEELDQFSISSKQVYYVIEDLQRESFLTDAKIAENMANQIWLV